MTTNIQYLPTSMLKRLINARDTSFHISNCYKLLTITNTSNLESHKHFSIHEF